MTNTNGRADTVGSPIQLGDFLPERREVVVNGQHYRAWVTTNRRFPRSVQAQLDQARNRYLRVVGPLLTAVAVEGPSGAEEPPARLAERERAVEQGDLAYSRYLTDAVLALVPGLGEQEADLIDQDAVTGLLTELGYLQTPIEVQTSAPAEGSGDAAPLTGDSPAPDLPATTPPVESVSS